MASSSATFPLFDIPEEEDTPTSFLKRARANAKEENVSLPKYLAGMLKHAIRGHDLAKIHFYQDGSGDTYDVDVLEKIFEEAHVESAAGQSYRCETAEEGLALLKKWKEEAAGRSKSNV
jgi:hypothetical protein